MFTIIYRLKAVFFFFLWFEFKVQFNFSWHDDEAATVKQSCELFEEQTFMFTIIRKVYAVRSCMVFKDEKHHSSLRTNNM